MYSKIAHVVCIKIVISSSSDLCESHVLTLTLACVPDSRPRLPSQTPVPDSRPRLPSQYTMHRSSLDMRSMSPIKQITKHLCDGIQNDVSVISLVQRYVCPTKFRQVLKYERMIIVCIETIFLPRYR